MKHTYITVSLGSYFVHLGMDLASKAIPIELPEPFNLKGRIHFPRLHYLPSDDEGAPYAELIHPVPMDDCGESATSELYGKISYVIENDVYIPHIGVREFVIDFETENYIDRNTVNKINAFVARSVDNAMCILSIIAPNCVSSNAPTSAYHYVAACSANYNQPKGNRMIEIGGAVCMMFFNDVLKPSTLFPIIRECHKEITLQYQMLAELNDFLLFEDYRSCILHASTIFESTLLKLVNDYLREKNTPEELIKFIHKKISGFRSYEDYYNMKILNKYPDSDRKVKTTTELRNKVIHEGKSVTRQEALDAYEAAKAFLEFYKWPYFVE